MHLEWSRNALSDMRSVTLYISAENPSAARIVTRRIRNGAQSLVDFPKLGKTGRITETRELIIPKTPYTLVYRYTDTTITVLAVIHTSRAWPPAF